MITLPIEIINKIFTYISSNTVNIIKESKFYGKTFPFFYLRQVEYETFVSDKIQNDYHLHINTKILENRDLYSDDQYYLFHIFTNDDTFEKISEHTGIRNLTFRIVDNRTLIIENVELLLNDASDFEDDYYSDDDSSAFNDDDFGDFGNDYDFQEFDMLCYY